MNKERFARLLAKTPGSSKWWGPPRKYGHSIGGISGSEGKEIGELRPERTIHHQLPDMVPYRGIEQEIVNHHSMKLAQAQRFYQLREARVLGDDFGHGVITNADRFLLDQYQGWGQPVENHPIHYVNRLPFPRRITGKSFSLVSLWSDNYWHWMFDVIGKLLLLIKNGDMPEINHYLVLNPDKFVFKKETLEAIGIDRNQIVGIARNEQYQCKELFLADRPCDIPYPESDLLDAIRKAYLRPSKGSVTRKIYISRALS